jgi:hypothetical protein
MAQCPVISWKPLGELLVERGLLTMDQLDEALQEQEATGERLGAILVARKAVPGVVLTTILAEQVGIELETQGGFGSGLFSKIAERHVTAIPEAPVLHTETAAASDDDGPEAVIAKPNDPAYELSALRAELEMARARNAQLEAELEALRTKPPARRRTSSKSAAV